MQALITLTGQRIYITILHFLFLAFYRWTKTKNVQHKSVGVLTLKVPLISKRICDHSLLWFLFLPLFCSLLAHYHHYYLPSKVSIYCWSACYIESVSCEKQCTGCLRSAGQSEHCSQSASSDCSSEGSSKQPAVCCQQVTRASSGNRQTEATTTTNQISWCCSCRVWHFVVAATTTAAGCTCHWHWHRCTAHCPLLMTALISDDHCLFFNRSRSLARWERSLENSNPCSFFLSFFLSFSTLWIPLNEHSFHRFFCTITTV